MAQAWEGYILVLMSTSSYQGIVSSPLYSKQISTSHESRNKYPRKKDIGIEPLELTLQHLQFSILWAYFHFFISRSAISTYNVPHSKTSNFIFGGVFLVLEVQLTGIMSPLKGCIILCSLWCWHPPPAHATCATLSPLSDEDNSDPDQTPPWTQATGWADTTLTPDNRFIIQLYWQSATAVSKSGLFYFCWQKQ